MPVARGQLPPVFAFTPAKARNAAFCRVKMSYNIYFQTFCPETPANPITPRIIRPPGPRQPTARRIAGSPATAGPEEARPGLRARELPPQFLRIPPHRSPLARLTWLTILARLAVLAVLYHTGHTYPTYCAYPTYHTCPADPVNGDILCHDYHGLHGCY